MLQRARPCRSGTVRHAPLESEMLRRLAFFVAIAMSVGWIVPLFLSTWFVLDWCRLEASPAVYGHVREANSFPFLAAATWMLNAAAIWAAGALVMWLIWGLCFVAYGKSKAETPNALTRDDAPRGG